MNPQAQANTHSAAWITFTYASFFASVAMVGFGILFAPIDMWIKAYFAMGAALLVQSCITMTKTLRDVHESGKLVNRIEDARAERLLMGMERSPSLTFTPARAGSASHPKPPSSSGTGRRLVNIGKVHESASKNRYIARSERNHRNVRPPDDIQALRTAVLVPVLLGVQRQFPEERAGLPDPVPRQPSRRPPRAR